MRKIIFSPIFSFFIFVLLALSHNADVHAQTVQKHSDIAALIQDNQPQQALDLIDAEITQNADNPQLLFLKANAQSALGDTKNAEQTLLALIQQYPELAEPLNNLAVIRASQGELAQARQLLEQSLRNDPKYVQAHINLAQLLIREASEHVSTAQQLQPSDSQKTLLNGLLSLAP